MKKLLPLFVYTALLAGPLLMALDCRKPNSNMQLKECAYINYQKVDNVFHEKYRKLMSLLPDDIAKEKLRAAQRAWVVYRNLSADFYADDARDGSAEQLIHMDTRTRMTEERTKELIKIIKRQQLYTQSVPTDTSGDVFIDTDTNLIWQDNIEAKTVKKNWQEAIDYCENLSLIGFEDWRLPDQNMLLTLYKKTDEVKNVGSDVYWSSTSDVNESDYAWSGDFDYGDGYHNDKNNDHYVRCVRDNQ